MYRFATTFNSLIYGHRPNAYIKVHHACIAFKHGLHSLLPTCDFANEVIALSDAGANPTKHIIWACTTS